MAAQASYIQPEQPDADEFERLVSLYYEPLYRFAMSLTRAEPEAADLVQDTFVAWAEKGSQLSDASKVKSWLFTTLYRCFLQGRRRTLRFPEVELDTETETGPSVDPEVVQRMEADDLMDVLGSIDPQYRAVIALFYLQDYSYAEIASILELPLGTVKSRLARGLAHLKQKIQERASKESGHPYPGGLQL